MSCVARADGLRLPVQVPPSADESLSKFREAIPAVLAAPVFTAQILLGYHSLW